VSETKLGTLRVAVLETGEELLLVLTDTTDDLEGAVRGVAVDTESRLDGGSETTLLNTEDDTGLLGEVELEETVEELVDDTCGRKRGSVRKGKGKEKHFSRRLHIIPLPLPRLLLPPPSL
jgi:hypothetical protein